MVLLTAGSMSGFGNGVNAELLSGYWIALDPAGLPFNVRAVPFGLICPAGRSPLQRGMLRRADWIGRALDAMRALLLLIPLLTGCAHQPAQQVEPANFRSQGIERCLRYWVANHSSYSINHFYVCATDLYSGDLVEALVYWREGGRLLDYSEMPKGAEAQAWRLRPKVDREAIQTDEKISGSNHVVPHRVWMRWVQQCITDGKEYVVTLKDAKASFPGPE